MWQRLAARGFGRRLQAIADDPCPPDVIGINHYLTSERLIDHRLEDVERQLADLRHVQSVLRDARRHEGSQRREPRTQRVVVQGPWRAA